MADVNRGNRPLSPHITIYRWPVTMLTSILIRITGIALVVSVLLVAWWLLAAATSPEYFEIANGVITSFLGDIVMTLSVLGLWMHALGGVRHLIWDQGVMLDVGSAKMLSWAMLIGSVVLTLATIAIA